MAINYFDSSAFFKRYVEESGSGKVRELLSIEPAIVSLLSIPEMGSALSRLSRQGRMSSENARMLFGRAVRDLQLHTTVEVSADLLSEAAQRLLRSTDPGLRTLDAVHVVSASRTFRMYETQGIPIGAFVAADRRLLDAAARSGLRTINPEELE